MRSSAKAFACLAITTLLKLLCLGGEGDLPGPSRPISQDFAVGRGQLERLNDEDYAQMDINDPRLKFAYSTVFHTTIAGEFEALPDHLQRALRDLRRRGNTVTPMFMKLLEANRDTTFEISLLATIGYVKSIDVAPFADYARRVLTERTSTMSASLAGVSAILLSEQGGKDDLELLRQVIAKRPYVAASIKSELPLLEKRIAGASVAPDTKAASQSAPSIHRQLPALKTAPETKPPTLAPSEEPTSSTPRSIIVFLILAASGLLWLLVKNRK
jgi:hypothetical protein